jgi:hypothetical protein
MGYYQTSSIHRKGLFIHLFKNKLSKKRDNIFYIIIKKKTHVAN